MPARPPCRRVVPARNIAGDTKIDTMMLMAPCSRALHRLPAVRLAILALAAVAATGATDGAELCSCAGFCSSSCSFGEGIGTQRLALYRRTPHSDLRLAAHDTGNLFGEVEFSLYSFSYAVAAVACRSRFSADCDLLANDSSTVYAAFEVEVDGRFAPYSGCNPRLPARTLQRSPPPFDWLCEVHSLQPEVANCTAAWQRSPALCPRLNLSVGRMSTSDACSAPRVGVSTAWDVWRCTVAKLFGDSTNASWFNTPSGGQCVGTQRVGDASGCTWRAAGGGPSKVVPAAAVDDAVASAVMAYSPQRFAACGAQAHNRSSWCWTTAFFDTITGNHTELPRMPLGSIAAAWKTAFDAARTCSSDADCGGGGACAQATGACACDPAWQGARCDELALHGDGMVAYGGPHSGITSWGGGPPVFDPATKQWTLFVTEIAGHCGLSEVS